MLSENINKGSDNEEKPKQSNKLVSLIKHANVKLFVDEYGEPYARFREVDLFQSRQIKSKHFKRWLCKKYWDKYNDVPNSESVNSALNIIEAQAFFNGQQFKLHNRVALHESSIWYDLADWRAVRIDNNGWEIVSDPPILFRSYNHQKVQVEPKRCHDSELNEILEEFMSFINIREKWQKLLFLVNLICGFVPDIPHPIDVLHGDQGTAKTTASTIKKELIDPSELKSLRYGNNYNEFVQQASHHWHLPLDNLTSLPGWFSDSLCRVVTGEGFSKRELYSNDDDVIYSLKRCITINGINMVPSKPDILERALIFEFEPISQTNRIDEEIFWKRFNESKSKFLGAIFSVLSKAMKLYPTIELNAKPRMADFARWGVAIALAMGRSEEEFLQAYKINIVIQNTEALEANPISRVIIAFMEKRTDWIGSATDLLYELEELASDLKIDTRDHRFPKDPRWLWKRVKEVKTNLFAEGIYVEKDDSRRAEGRKIILRKVLCEENKFGSHVPRNDVSDVMLSEGRNDNKDNIDNIFDNFREPDVEAEIDEFLREID